MILSGNWPMTCICWWWYLQPGTPEILSRAWHQQCLQKLLIRLIHASDLHDKRSQPRPVTWLRPCYLLGISYHPLLTAPQLSLLVKHDYRMTTQLSQHCDTKLTTSNHKLAVTTYWSKARQLTRALDYIKYKQSESLLRLVHHINNSNLKRGKPQASDYKNNTKRELRSTQTSTLSKQYSNARSGPQALD